MSYNLTTMQSIYHNQDEIVEITYNNSPVYQKGSGPDYSEPFWVKNVGQASTNISFGNSKVQNKEYSTDKINWGSWSNNVTIQPGQKVYFRSTVGDNMDECTLKTSNNGNDSIHIGGNVLSLWRGSNFTGEETSWHADTTQGARYAMYGVFRTPAIEDASKLLLPVVIYNNNDSGIYGSTFRDNIKMVYGPKELPMPVQTYSNDGGNFYNKMFAGCSNLLEGPDVKLTSAKNGGLNEMFQDCTSLTKAYFKHLTGTWPTANNMFSGVNTTGEIYVPTGADLTNITLPADWTIVYV